MLYIRNLHFACFSLIICVILTTKIFSLPNIAPHRDVSFGSSGKVPSTLHFDSKFRRRFSFSRNHVNINESVSTIHRAGWIPDPVWKPWRRGISLSTITNRTPVHPSSNPQSYSYTNRNIPFRIILTVISNCFPIHNINRVIFIQGTAGT